MQHHADTLLPRAFHNRLAAVLLTTGLALGMSACAGREPGGPTATASETAASSGAQDLTNPARKRTAESIISTFENSTTEIQYDYAEELGDGRGITAGRAGFTSGTSDLLMVVEQYLLDTQTANNPLMQYLAPLQAVDGTDSTEGLDGFVEEFS